MGKKKAKKQGNAAEQTIRAKFAAANGGFGFAVPLDQKKSHTISLFHPPIPAMRSTGTLFLSGSGKNAAASGSGRKTGDRWGKLRK